MQKLYWAGGRRFLISGVGPLGCIPNQIGSAGGNSSACVSSTNMLARQFNANLRSMLRHLDGTLPGSRFLFWDTYSSSWDIINNFSLYGWYPPKATSSSPSCPFSSLGFSRVSVRAHGVLRSRKGEGEGRVFAAA